MSGSARATAIEIDSDSDDLSTVKRKLPLASSAKKTNSIRDDIFGPPRASSSTSAKHHSRVNEISGAATDSSSIPKTKQHNVRNNLEVPNPTSSTPKIKREIVTEATPGQSPLASSSAFKVSTTKYHSIANDIFGPLKASSSTSAASAKTENTKDWAEQLQSPATIKQEVRPIKRQKKNDRTASDVTKKQKKKRPMNGQGRSEKDEESEFPDYITRRLAKRDVKSGPVSIEDMPLPPDYEDLDFTDDEDADLEKKPNLGSHIEPSRPYEDFELDTGAVIPASIAQYLREYQIEGVKRLHKAFVYQKGLILGDDMGLGKTIQIIAFLTAAFGKTADKRDAKRMRKMRRQKPDNWYPRILLVLPKALIANWRAEFDRWGYWSVENCHGSDAKIALEAASAGYIEVMITTFNTFVGKQDAINAIEWDCVIVDECHTIKEPSAQITKAMRNVNAISRIGLTGTPQPNKYAELWTLFDWITLGRCGSLRQWKIAFFDKLLVGQSNEATDREVAEKRRVQLKLREEILPPMFLRRMKSIVAHQLPKKTDRIIFCPLTEEQKRAYNNLCNDELFRAMRISKEVCDCLSGKKRGWCCYTDVNGIECRPCMFPSLQVLKSLCCHTSLIIPSQTLAEDQLKREKYFLTTALPESAETLYAQRDNIWHCLLPSASGKWKVLEKMLEVWYEKGDKVLVFCHSVQFLKMLRLLVVRRCDYATSYMDGSMSSEERLRAVDDFNSDPKQFLFLISTKAGGTGLNLTAANIVCILDPSWAPSHDLQAQDRAYRIGQERDVEVYRFVSADTIEEAIYARQIYKQQQTAIVLDGGVQRRYFSGIQNSADRNGEIFGLYNLLAPTNESHPWYEILNKTNVAETRTGNLIVGLDLEAAAEHEDALDDEDMVMSELARSIVDPDSQGRKKSQLTAKKKDPIAAILDMCGVKNTHEHADVLKSSKIEQQISARASKVGNDYGLNKEYAFVKEGRDVAYRYNPPEDVRIRQFCSMAKYKGYDDMSEFAFAVEGWSSNQRRKFLEGWYRYRREAIEKDKSEDEDEL